jgi:hypothetical protein
MKKGTKREEFQHNEERKKDNEQRKKVRHIGRYLPLVALAMGSGVASEFADEFFDEDYLKSMELIQFWPEGRPIEPWDMEDSDKTFETDEYVEQ